jgi:hypothetical protein
VQVGRGQAEIDAAVRKGDFQLAPAQTLLVDRKSDAAVAQQRGA